MTKRIFRSVILTALAVFVACLALVVGALYSYFSARQESQLTTEARLAAAERTTASRRMGFSFSSYSTVTWLFPSGLK